MNARELTDLMLQTVKDIRAAGAELERCSREYARAERSYRLSRATALLAAHGGTVSEREAHADQATADVRYERDLADGLRTSALEAVRSHRGVLSALQSLAALERSEAELAKWGPEAAVPG
jgi:hypothetical protein